MIGLHFKNKSSALFTSFFIQVWKRWVTNKNTGQERLNTVIASLLLRRTKSQLVEKGHLNCMPERSHELITVTLEKTEMDVYQKVLIFSRTLFAQFLHQRAQKNSENEISISMCKIISFFLISYFYFL